MQKCNAVQLNLGKQVSFDGLAIPNASHGKLGAASKILCSHQHRRKRNLGLQKAADLESNCSGSANSVIRNFSYTSEAAKPKDRSRRCAKSGAIKTCLCASTHRQSDFRSLQASAALANPHSLPASCLKDNEILATDNQNRINKTSPRRPLLSCLLALALLVGDASLLAASADAFPFFGPSQEKDPVEPFVIYGTIDKKFLIEKIEEGRIVGRKKGFTASVCAKCVGASSETPEFLGLPTGMKMEEAPGEQSCSKWEAQSKDEACEKPCKRSCDDAISRQVRLERASTGYELEAGDRQKATKGCISACENECGKPGRSSSFVVPIRP